MSVKLPKENLRREIGVRSLTLAILNITIGTGIFVIPATVALNLGAAAILAYLVCGVLIFLIALCFAEVGSKTEASGGIYTYIENAFGPFAGFLASNVYWIGSSVVADAALANALADTLNYFFPQLASGIFRITFFVLLFSFFAFLNIRSMKYALRFVEIAAIAKLAALLLFVILGFGFVHPHNLQWANNPGFSEVASASLLLFYAFMGLETPLSNGGEIRNPRRTVPIAVLLGITGVLILYISIQLVAQGILGADLPHHKEAPLAVAAGSIFGDSGMLFILIASVISMLGFLGGELLSIPRILYASARDGNLPKFIGKVHPTFLTPHNSIVVYGAMGLLFAIFGAFKQLAIISSAAALLNYLGIVLATIKLRKNGNEKSTFRVPGGVFIPLLAAAAIIWLLSSLEIKELIGICIFVFVFTIIYFVTKRIKEKKWTF